MIPSSMPCSTVTSPRWHPVRSTSGSRAMGVTHSHIRQVARAQRAAALLQHGTSIADAVYALGYYDQPHLNRALKRWIGQTPTELIRREPAA